MTFPKRELLKREHARDRMLDMLFYEPPMHMTEDEINRMLDFAMDGPPQLSPAFYDAELDEKDFPVSSRQYYREDIPDRIEGGNDG
jgi:hypothetical protein